MLSTMGFLSFLPLLLLASMTWPDSASGQQKKPPFNVRPPQNSDQNPGSSQFGKKQIRQGFGGMGVGISPSALEMGPAGGRGTDFGRPMEGQSRPPQFGGPSMRPVRPQWPSEIPRQGPMDGNVFPAGPTGGAWGNLQGPGGPPANPGQGGIWDRLSPQGADKIIPRAIQGPPPRSPPRRPKGGDRNPRPGGPRPGGRSPGGPSGGMRPDVINPDIMVTQKFFPIIKVDNVTFQNASRYHLKEGENIFYLPDGGAGLPPPPPQVPNAPQAMGYGYPYSRVQPYLKLIYNPSNPQIISYEFGTTILILMRKEK